MAVERTGMAVGRTGTEAGRMARAVETIAKAAEKTETEEQMIGKVVERRSATEAGRS